jgi:hypothetical protein
MTKTKLALPELTVVGEVSPVPDTAEQKTKQLPDPSGYRILCAVPDAEKAYDSGLLKADVTVYQYCFVGKRLLDECMKRVGNGGVFACGM